MKPPRPSIMRESPSRSGDGVRREAVAIRPTPVAASRVRRARKLRRVLGVEAVMLARPAGENGDAGPRQPGEPRVRRRARRREARRREAVRRGQGRDDVRPAQGVVLRHPDQVGGARAGDAGPSGTP